MTPPGLLKTAGAIIRKDLRTELRSRESVPAMLLFAVMTLVLFHFALDSNSVEGPTAAGVYWVTVLFAAVLAINRLLVTEREQGGFDAILLAPIDRTAIFLAKSIVLFAYLTLLESLTAVAFAVLLLAPPLTQAMPELLFVVLLANVGLAVIGTLVSSLAIHARTREVIVPLLSLPLILPLLIAAANATQPLFGIPAGEFEGGKWLPLIGLYDTVFGLIGYGVYDFLLED